ncbi:DUF3160 domain-containing protein [Hymenobacter negativus]|uniref:DUF3160 domain-containing protein n=1 Tax=Hymenobacter negativus TaxID=2795026 RepID=A0ABS3QJ36_9BACT|nr:DUF3160 domain-containing protein [Hymenobacter negativus]MBO2010794.1 DUF3160 domain-containing protein [Hymenobacter negativus]
MNRKLLLPLLAVAALLALGTAWFFWQRHSANPSATGPASAALVAPPGTTLHDNGFGEQVPVQLTEDKGELAKIYARPYIKEYYEGYGETSEGEIPKRAPLPAFDYNQPLAGKSYLDLMLLRNTLYARNGYCFMNATLRRYFDKTAWYTPLWDEGTDSAGVVTAPKLIPVPLNKQEVAFEQKVLALETKLQAGRLTKQGGFSMINPDFITNQREFLLPPALLSTLTRSNFAVVPTREEQLFYLYDKGEYAFTPAFVTTDLFLQLLHKYLNGILSDVEEKRLGPIVADMLRQGNAQARTLAQQSQLPAAHDAAEWAAAYYAVGHELLTGQAAQVPATYATDARTEVTEATAAAGKGSVLLQDSLFQYQALKPRGMYTRNDTTKRYFRTVKWLNSAPVFLDSDAGLLRAVALAKALAGNPAATRGFQRFTQVLDVLAGDEDNRSLTNLLKLLGSPAYAGKTLDQLATPAVLAQLRPALLATGTDRIRPKGVTAHAQDALDRPTLLFTAGRYTFDAEILSRLTEVLNRKRPFPKGLDVFATFGNHTAQDVLLSHYHEAAQWPAYPDTLRQLQKQLAKAPVWDRNLYTKTLQTLLSLNAPAPATVGTPLFARTPAWQKRNLSTALGGWAELKHDLLLYSEQPMAAEMGDGGGGPPEPIILAYVEPNLPFWEAALGLLAFQDQALTRLKVNTEHLSGLNKEMREKITKLRTIAQQELRGEKVSTDYMAEMAQIGGWAEQLTFNILKTDRLPDRERHVGVVADVYAFNAEVLEEAVGAVDALYTVVDINGTTVVAVGPVFSYYEFRSQSRLTDEEWQAKLNTSPPPRPTWLQELLVPVAKLNTKSDR